MFAVSNCLLPLAPLAPSNDGSLAFSLFALTGHHSTVCRDGKLAHARLQCAEGIAGRASLSMLGSTRGSCNFGASVYGATMIGRPYNEMSSWTSSSSMAARKAAVGAEAGRVAPGPYRPNHTGRRDDWHDRHTSIDDGYRF